MAELSPQTQAVLAAYLDGGLSASLQAAADQVVPVEISLRRGMRPGGTGSTTSDEFKQDQRCETRRRLLAIASELKGNHD